METYSWYQIFNLDEFLATNLVSREFDVVLIGQGAKKILVTKGNHLGLLYEETFLKIEEAETIYEFNEHASFLDSDRNVWLGIPI